MNTHAVILAALFVLWAVSVFAWVMAARRAGQEAKRVAALGLGMGVATLVVFGLWMAEYGALVVPTLLAVASAGIPLVGAWVVVRNRPRGDDVDRASVDGAMAQEPIPAEAERAGD